VRPGFTSGYGIRRAQPQRVRSLAHALVELEPRMREQGPPAPFGDLGMQLACDAHFARRARQPEICRMKTLIKTVVWPAFAPAPLVRPAQTALDNAITKKSLTVAIPTDFPPYGSSAPISSRRGWTSTSPTTSWRSSVSRPSWCR